MQAIFAYQTSKQAEYNICKKQAQDQFMPDLNSMEEQDKDALKADREEVALVYDQIFEKGIESVAPETKPEIIKEAQHYLENYNNGVKEIIRKTKVRLLDDLSRIFDDYIKLLVLIIEIEKEITSQKAKKNNTHNNFAKNQVIKALKNFEKLEVERVRKNIGWDSDIIKTWLKKYLKTNTIYQDFDDLPKANFEQDAALVTSIYKSIIFKNENINDYFESQDIGWTEDKSILKSMVLKTIKSIESEDDEPLMMALSKNWDEDLDFLKELFDLSVNNEDELLERIKEKSKNWEVDRMAITDKIILEMAVAEMSNFPSIPVKVTINEYIELSKQYSTPKSKQYVNGLLDVLSVDLQKEGVIKKSGRGLLDNK
ncbi:MAG: transcription antitermination factor NusB [Reichenbachiella sp.]